MNRKTVSLATPLVFALGLGGAGCDSDPAFAVGQPALLQIEGTVGSDAGGALESPVLVRVFRPDGRGGWGEAVPDAAGRYSVEIELRDGCESGSPLEAAARIHDPDHRNVDEDLGGGRTILCTPQPQSLDYTLFREIFRTPVPVAGDLQASEVSGYRMRCALTPDGVSCWGLGVAAPTPVPGSGGFRHLDVAFAHACALDEDGAAWCWGSNPNGALGVPGLEASDVPVRVETNLGFVELATHHESSCGLTGDGELHCWGRHGGETPEPLGAGLRFQQLAGLFDHMCGVAEGGELYCWGGNSRGQLARGGGGWFAEPVRVDGIGEVASVATGVQFTCALTPGGDPYCWGWNCDAQLGSGVGPVAEVHEPAALTGAPPFAQMALGARYTCGLTSSGEAWCVGLNSRGQLGTETPRLHAIDPVQVSGDVRFQSIAAGFRGSCGISVEGRVHCWGDRMDLGTGLPLEPDAQAGWTARAISPSAPPPVGSCT